jgi:hypothetical protein
MKKTIKKFIAIICAAALLTGAAATLSACSKKKETFLKTSDVKGYGEAVADGALSIEWLDGYNPAYPTAVIFHGENETYFSPDIPLSVYTSDATYYSDKINESTIGWKAKGLVKTSDKNYYKLSYYWKNTAHCNVAVFHCEKFFEDETTDDDLTKILTAYKSRYTLDGTVKDCDFGYPLAEVAAALFIEEMTAKNASGKEIRFIGAGVGADLAAAVSYYLAASYKKGLIGADYLPSRLTLCDPYLDTAELSYEAEIGYGLTADGGALGAIAEMVKTVSELSVAVELIECEEVNGDVSAYAYSYTRTEGADALFTELKSYAAYLLVSEKYSVNSSFDAYKAKKRLAFDWYFYSVVGSDDSFSRDYGAGSYAVGYPHAYADYFGYATTASINWGTNGTRPILNNRAVSNDYNEGAGASRGKNYGVSAWTPTVYIRALRGIGFTQEEAVSTAGSDVHGTNVYNYEKYVLPTFRSENYQVSDETDYTLLCGYVYFDENADGIIDDGVTNGLSSKIYVSVTDDTTETVYCDKVVMMTDANGFYCIRINDGTTGSVTFTADSGGGVIDGFCAQKNDIIVTLTYFCERGYDASNGQSSAIFYERMSENGFNKGTSQTEFTVLNAHSVYVVCCLAEAE